MSVSARPDAPGLAGASVASLDARSEPARRRIALLGNPNSGKSTLFNALTGLRQKVGNYPGVTVEKKIGVCTLPSGRRVELLDLPGSYSLQPGSPDEVIVRDVLLDLLPDTPPPDLIVLVVDATHLERHLYLVLQVLEIGRPTIVALNMIDTAEELGIRIDTTVLERRLGAPVVEIAAARGRGLGNLRRLMDRDIEPSTRHFRQWPDPVRQAVEHLEARLPRQPHGRDRGRRDVAIALLLDDGEDDALARAVPAALLDDLPAQRAKLDTVDPGWRNGDVLGRYDEIAGMLEAALVAPGLGRDRCGTGSIAC